MTRTERRNVVLLKADNLIKHIEYVFNKINLRHKKDDYVSKWESCIDIPKDCIDLKIEYYNNDDCASHIYLSTYNNGFSHGQKFILLDYRDYKETYVLATIGTWGDKKEYKLQTKDKQMDLLNEYLLWICPDKSELLKSYKREQLLNKLLGGNICS
jgi:hypothetical protein